MNEKPLRAILRYHRQFFDKIFLFILVELQFVFTQKAVQIIRKVFDKLENKTWF
jgi:hypothetical protein